MKSAAEANSSGHDIADVNVLPAMNRTETVLSDDNVSTIQPSLPPGYTPATPHTHVAKSITQKSILALGFKRRAPWVTLTLFDAGTGQYPAYSDGSLIAGEITLESNEEESLEDVIVEFRGWTPSLGQKSRHDILYIASSLPLPDKLNKTTGKLPAGSYTLPFCIGPVTDVYTAANGAQYPLPSSFVSNGFGGFVQYEVNVTAKRKAVLGVDAKITQIVAYVPRSRPAPPSRDAMMALREGRIRPGPDEDAEGWQVKSFPAEGGGSLEIALPVPLVYPRGQPLLLLARHRSSPESAPSDESAIPNFKVELQQIAALGEDATEGESVEDRPVSFCKAIGVAGPAQEHGGSIGKGWLMKQIQIPGDSKPNFTFPKFSLAYRLAVYIGSSSRPSGGLPTSSSSTSLSESNISNYIPVVICTHPFTASASRSHSRTASPAPYGNHARSASAHGSGYSGGEIRVISSPEEVGRVPEPPTQPGKRLLGGQKRVAPRVGPADWQPVGSVG